MCLNSAREDRAISQISVIETNVSMASGVAVSKPTFWSASARLRRSAFRANSSDVVKSTEQGDSSGGPIVRMTDEGISRFLFVGGSSSFGSAERFRVLAVIAGAGSSETRNGAIAPRESFVSYPLGFGGVGFS